MAAIEKLEEVECGFQPSSRMIIAWFLGSPHIYRGTTNWLALQWGQLTYTWLLECIHGLGNHIWNHQCADTAGISLEGGIPLKGPKSMKVLRNIARATIQTEMGVRSSVACSATRPFPSSEQEASHSNLRWETTDQNSAQGHSSPHGSSMACGIWDILDGSFYPEEAVNGPNPNRPCNVWDLCSPACGGTWVCQAMFWEFGCHQVGLLHFSDVLQLATCWDCPWSSFSLTSFRTYSWMRFVRIWVLAWGSDMVCEPRPSLL